MRADIISPTVFKGRIQAPAKAVSAMLKRSGIHKNGCMLAVLLAAPAISLHAQTAAGAPIKKQLPADERAFKVARANVDPDQRLAAMREFLKAYPESSRANRAENDIFKILVSEYPRRSDELNAEIKSKLQHAKGVQERADAEEEIASLLAEAEPAGIELQRAEELIQDALAHSSELDYDKQTLAMYAKYKVPAPKPEELHAQFANSRAELLSFAADVYLREGKPAQAAPLIAEAYTLDPKVDDVNTERGRLALLNHDDALALASFERAHLLGTLDARDRATMMQLYRSLHGGSDAGFEAEMDARYAQLYPPPFTPGKPKQVPPGRTVLLELFTGSACPPCVGADAAVDGLLQAYPRSEFVALAFDQHIPEPDPLANPDSTARADFYGVDHAPSFVVDGEPQSFFGGSREGSKDLYDKLAAKIDADAAQPDALHLAVAAVMADDLVHAHAAVTLPSAAPSAAAETASSAILNFALVEDDIRYSGENGVRFHRMVVRSLAKPANSGFSASAGTSEFEASFNPAAISRELVSYLDAYEQKNDKFGKIKFISKEMTMRPEHLLVAVWVQDPVSHRVLQAAVVPVSGPRQEGAE
jgi:hypothetical protein